MPKWVKTIIAVLLLPACLGAAKALWLVLRHSVDASSFNHVWITVLAGAGCWVSVFLNRPPPMRIYVFGHELAHALWTWLFGGEVEKFAYSDEFGHSVRRKPAIDSEGNRPLIPMGNRPPLPRLGKPYPGPSDTGRLLMT